MAPLNILVTGGAGFIGSHLVDALIARGHRVRVLDTLAAQVHGADGPEYLNPTAEFIQGDAGDAPTITAALEGIDVVYHLAAAVGVGQSMYELPRYVGNNTFGTSVLLQAVVERRAHIRKLIVASSMSLYGEGAYRSESGEVVHPRPRALEQLDAHQWEMVCPRTGTRLRPIATSEDAPLSPTSVYAITKQDQEQLCLVVGRAYGIPTVALRYFNAYGPRQALSNPYTGVCAIFLARLLNDHPPIIFEDGAQTRDFVHVSDIVQANLLALDTDRADYQPINVATGRPLAVKTVAEILAQGLGKRIRPEIVGRHRNGDIRHCAADLTRAQTLLGYAPKVSPEEGMKDLLDWVRTRQAADRVMQATAELSSRRLVR